MFTPSISRSSSRSPSPSRVDQVRSLSPAHATKAKPSTSAVLKNTVTGSNQSAITLLVIPSPHEYRVPSSFSYTQAAEQRLTEMINAIRTPGVWDHIAGDIAPIVLSRVLGQPIHIIHQNREDVREQIFDNEIIRGQNPITIIRNGPYYSARIIDATDGQQHEVSIPRDGDCLYRAIETARNYLRIPASDQATFILRHRLANYMEQRRDEFLDFTYDLGAVPQVSLNIQMHQSVNQWIRLLEQTIANIEKRVTEIDQAQSNTFFIKQTALFNDLPREVLRKIIDFGSPTELACLNRVNRHMRNMTLPLWRETISTTSLNTSLCSETIDQFLFKKGLIEKGEFVKKEDIPSEICREIFHRFPETRTRWQFLGIGLIETTSLTDQAIDDVITHLLQHFNLPAVLDHQHASRHRLFKRIIRDNRFVRFPSDSFLENYSGRLHSSELSYLHPTILKHLHPTHSFQLKETLKNELSTGQLHPQLLKEMIFAIDECAKNIITQVPNSSLFLLSPPEHYTPSFASKVPSGHPYILPAWLEKPCLDEKISALSNNIAIDALQILLIDKELLTALQNAQPDIKTFVRWFTQLGLESYLLNREHILDVVSQSTHNNNIFSSWFYQENVESRDLQRALDQFMQDVATQRLEINRLDNWLREGAIVDEQALQKNVVEAVASGQIKSLDHLDDLQETAIKLESELYQTVEDYHHDVYGHIECSSTDSALTDILFDEVENKFNLSACFPKEMLQPPYIRQAFGISAIAKGYLSLEQLNNWLNHYRDFYRVLSAPVMYAIANGLLSAHTIECWVKDLRSESNSLLTNEQIIRLWKGEITEADLDRQTYTSISNTSSATQSKSTSLVEVTSSLTAEHIPARLFDLLDESIQRLQQFNNKRTQAEKENFSIQSGITQLHNIRKNIIDILSQPIAQIELNDLTQWYQQIEQTFSALTHIKTHPQTCAVEAGIAYSINKRKDDPDDSGDGASACRKEIPLTLQPISQPKTTEKNSCQIQGDGQQQGGQTQSLSLISIHSKTATLLQSDKTSDQKSRLRAIKDFNQQYKQLLTMVRPFNLIGLRSFSSQSKLASHPEIQQAIKMAISADKQADTHLRKIDSYRLPPPGYVNVSHHIESTKHASYERQRHYSGPYTHVSAMPLDKNTMPIITSLGPAIVNREEKKDFPKVNQHLAIEYRRK